MLRPVPIQIIRKIDCQKKKLEIKKNKKKTANKDNDFHHLTNPRT